VPFFFLREFERSILKNSELPLDVSFGSELDTTNDELLARLLQHELDVEHDSDLRRQEAKYNGNSKGEFDDHARTFDKLFLSVLNGVSHRIALYACPVSVSFANYRRNVEADSDSDEEVEDPRYVDSFEVSRRNLPECFEHCVFGPGASHDAEMRASTLKNDHMK
jgi:hypothetical protein